MGIYGKYRLTKLGTICRKLTVFLVKRIIGKYIETGYDIMRLSMDPVGLGWAMTFRPNASCDWRKRVAAMQSSEVVTSDCY